MKLIAKLGLTIALFASLGATSTACCAVALAGVGVKFGGQSNIVIWDEKNQIEHFVRYASFDSTAKDMGFIAPTPSLPEIVEVNPKAYEFLDSIKPYISPSRAAKSASAAAAPTVLQVVDTGDYIATTLKAEDPNAFVKYLSENGYAMTPGVKVWADFYIKKKWLLTAFKLKKSKEKLALKPVRMSFKTTEPFNPYYIPDENIEGPYGSGLVLYFISNPSFRLKGTDKNLLVQGEWTSGKLDSIRPVLAPALRLEEDQIPAGAVVTRYTSPVFPSKGNQSEDLFFVKSDKPLKPAVEDDPKQRAPFLQPFPMAVLSGIILLFGAQWYFVLRSKKKIVG
jgi:hypothetical protein